MNYSEKIAHEDSNMLDGAHRIIVKIRDDVKIGIVGNDLKRKYQDRINLLNDLRTSVSDVSCENQIYKWIEEVNKYLKWETP